MATVPAVPITKPPTDSYNGVAIIQWAPLTFAGLDDGAPVDLVQYADRSIQVFGTFGTGGSVRIEGSLDGTNWAVLTDPQGNDLNITTSKIEAVAEMTRFIRPRVTAGDGTTSVTVMLVARAD